MAVRLIALDIDGTLLDSRWRLPDGNRAAVRDATRRGIEVALVTGRRYDFALPVARDLGCPLTMIVNNGALVRTHDGRTQLRHLLPVETARRVLDATRPWREGAAVLFDRPLANQVIFEHLDWDDPIRQGYYGRNREFLAQVAPLEDCLTEEPLQVMFTGSVAAMREALDVLRDADFAAGYSLASTVYEKRNFAMVDVIHPACTKGSALAEWAAIQGLAPAEVMAIGDNHNDLEMLTFAGVPVVMGNSVPELKAFGWHQTLSNDDCGVAAAIAQFVLQEAPECA
jgi:Cof subfamily protein (haloacid dehalogenase superfamily)